ncbi:porin [Thiothrix winogradskyi]|uniref:Porin n=1 Tax=Thiothrix winogradskyi TaxID=96472 RepID=A0ABY3T489_9GAMM|nr:porin [Thiothrix winogradskyi]UJS26386.1 porin [Thiothrix winogradskyi]
MQNTLRITLVAAAIAAVCATPAMAADDLQALKAQMETMQKRIAELETKQSAAPVAKAEKSAKGDKSDKGDSKEEGWIANSKAMNLYGRVGLSVDNKSGDITNEGTTLNSNASLLGVKGTLPSGYGETDVIYQMELEYDTTNSTTDSTGKQRDVLLREAYAGVKSDKMGTLRAGRLSTGYKGSLTTIDPWLDTAMQSRNGGRQGSSELHSNYFNNTLMYETPKLGSGVKANVWYATNTDNTQLNNAGSLVNFKGGSATGLGVKYKNKAVFLAADMIDMNADNVSSGVTNGSGWQVAAQYKPDKVGVAALYEDVDELGFGKNTYVNATYDATPKTTLVAAYGKNEGRVPNGNKDWDNWSIGVQQKIHKKSQLFAAYNSRKDSADLEENTITIGTKINFGD